MSLPRRARRFGATLSSLALVASLLFVGTAAQATMVMARPELDPVFVKQLSRLDTDAPYNAFVHFAGGATKSQRAFLHSQGLTTANAFPSVDVVVAYGPAARFRALLDRPEITYLEANRKLRYFGETGPWATDARVVTDLLAGTRYDGSGVGVAIVDSGINDVHPDLANRVEKNFKYVCPSQVLVNTTTEKCYTGFNPGSPAPSEALGPFETPMTDTTSGHGTHVAGIVAGDGTQSKGTFRGVAPGASLYGFGTGEVIFVAAAAEAFEFIIENYDSRDVFPVPIKVINNSWGDGPDDAGGVPEGPDYNPNALLSKLTKQLVDKGVTMVYAAGNAGSGPAGATPGGLDRTSSTCKDPTPGVICVANYDDWAGATTGTGTKSGVLNSGSSRGRAGVHDSYPDVSAPGTFITSACVRQVQPICNIGIVDEVRWAPWYGTISGTSMASPHVAGAAALLLEANPNATPAEIENAIQDSANRFAAGGAYEADPQNPGDLHSFDKGAGLLDVPAALRALGTATAVSGGPYVSIAGDGGDFPGNGAADIVGLTVSEQPDGMRYDIEVRDATDVIAQQSTTLRLSQAVGTAARVTSVTIGAAGASIPARNVTTNNAVASSVTVNGNDVSVVVPFSELGDPGPNTAGRAVGVVSFTGAVADKAPGGLGAEQNLQQPWYGAPFMVHPEDVGPDPDPTTSPSPTPTGSATPTPTPTETIPVGDPAATTQFYFHSILTGVNQPDQVIGQNPYDTVFPVASDAVSIDVPVVRGTGSDSAWEGAAGAIDGAITSLTVDFHYRAPVLVAPPAYDVSIDVGGVATDLPTMDVPPTGPEVGHATHTFTGLNIPAAGQAVTITFASVNALSPTSIVFDSAEHPSGFTVNPEGGGDPDPTVSPTVTPTVDPTEPPSGGCSSYPLIPNDPYFGGEAPAEFTPQQWGPRVINATDAWQEGSSTGCGIRVAVLDSGLDIKEGSSGMHPDFACSSDKVFIAPGSDRVTGDSEPDDENGHGTHVAGIIGACTNNGRGTMGVAPDSTIVPVRVLDAAGSGNDAQLITGLDKAVEAGAHVINMSLSYRQGKEIINDVAAIDAALERARAAGIVIVAAAGNDSLPLCNYPALAEDVVCVGATDPRDLRTWYSNGASKFYEPGVFDHSVVAPGGTETIAFCDVYHENVLSTYSREQDTVACSIDDGYQTVNGTSMAAPHVAGVAALVYERLGGIASVESAQQVVQAITASAVDLGAPGPDPIFGHGRVDALGAVRAIDAVPATKSTVVEFTADSAQVGQHSDEATIAGQLRDEDGLPIAGAELAFELVGADGTTSWTATTDLTGVASSTRTLTDQPGDYQLFVHYAGLDGTFEPSSNTATFVVLKETSQQVLNVTGNGSKRVITAVLSEDDGPAIAGATIVFFANGTSIGEAVTDASGTASLPAPPGWRGKDITFESRFDPTASYDGSSAQKAV